jgi:hypothetical protein
MNSSDQETEKIIKELEAIGAMLNQLRIDGVRFSDKVQMQDYNDFVSFSAFVKLLLMEFKILEKRLLSIEKIRGMNHGL